MKWTFVNKKMIRHVNGYEISLSSGTWACPLDISPNFPANIDSVLLSRLLREGLNYAAKKSRVTYRTKTKQELKPTKKKNRPVLTLKNKAMV